MKSWCSALWWGRQEQNRHFDEKQMMMVVKINAQWTWTWANPGETVKDREAWNAVPGVRHNWATEQQQQQKPIEQYYDKVRTWRECFCTSLYITEVHGNLGTSLTLAIPTPRLQTIYQAMDTALSVWKMEKCQFRSKQKFLDPFPGDTKFKTSYRGILHGNELVK